MNRLENVLNFNKQKNKTSFIVYLTSGYPDIDTTLSIVLELAKIGVDVVEIGFPFSDPVADGPVIQKTSLLSLKKGYKLKDHFRLLKEIRKKSDIPLVIMTYSNIVYKSDDYDLFCYNAKESGADGIIVADMQIDEGVFLTKSCEKYNLAPVFIVSSDSSDDRLIKVSKLSKGFIYVVSRPGVTGGKTGNVNDLSLLVKRLHNFTNIPLCVGFGISSKKDVVNLSKIFDGIIIGTAFLKQILKNNGKIIPAINFIKRLL